MMRSMKTTMVVQEMESLAFARDPLKPEASLRVLGRLTVVITGSKMVAIAVTIEIGIPRALILYVAMLEHN